MSNLKDKVAVITGGTTGIGYATARLFVQEGAQVVITGNNKDNVSKAASSLATTGIVANQTNINEIEALANEVERQFNKIDILFLNAGTAMFSAVENETEEHYDRQMNLNVKGTYFTAQKFLPVINNGGAIIINTSVNAVLAAQDSSVYAASKAALISLNRVLAREVAPRKIRVNAIVPGPIDTPLYSKLGMTEEQIQGMEAALRSRILLGRFGRPEEIAKLVKFLASDDASFINGTDIIIDGGLTVNALFY